MEHPWTQRARPERLERRIEFADYESTRDFLEKLNVLSEQTGRFPDISFGRTYVNLTVRAENDSGGIGPSEHSLAAEIDELL